MEFNVYIQVVLILFTGSIFLGWLASFTVKTKYKIPGIITLLVMVVVAVDGYFNNFNAPEVQDDLIGLYSFLMSLVLIAPLASFLKLMKAYKLITFLAMTYMIILFMLFLLVGQNSALGIVKMSTPQGYAALYLGYVGLINIVNNKYKSMSIVIVLLSIAIQMMYLTKWSYVSLTIYLLCIAYVFSYGKLKKATTKVMVFVSVSIVLAIAVIFLSENYLGLMRNYAGYSIFDYWQHKLAASRIDGGRFEIWEYAISEWKANYQNIMFGLGLGFRHPIFHVREHNVFIFIMVRFGLVLFAFIIFSIGWLLINFYKSINNRKESIIIFSAIILSFLLSCVYGEAYSYIVVSFAFGITNAFLIGERTEMQ